MESVSVSRQIDGSIESISSAIHDVKPFMKAAGFDEVIVDGSTIRVANQVGPIHIELTLKIQDVDGAALFYEQIDGIFDAMTTVYVISETTVGTSVNATTRFALDAAVVGSVLDAVVIKRQRRKELAAQLDYLQDHCGSDD